MIMMMTETTKKKTKTKPQTKSEVVRSSKTGFKKKPTVKPKVKPKKPSSKPTAFAVIATGGKQYRVSVGDLVSVELLPEKAEGDKVIFNEVLLKDSGTKTDIGSPMIKTAKVEGTIEEVGRAKKITVIRFRAKSRHFKKKGHRQPFTKVRITKI